MAAEDPSVSGVSGRYATALFELARDEKSIDAVKADLDRFAAMLADSADLKTLKEFTVRDLLPSPFVIVP